MHTCTHLRGRDHYIQIPRPHPDQLHHVRRQRYHARLGRRLGQSLPFERERAGFDFDQGQ